MQAVSFKANNRWMFFVFGEKNTGQRKLNITKIFIN